MGDKRKLYDQPATKPTAAYYLTLIGSILGIIVGIVLVLLVIGIWIVIANILTLYYAQKMMEQPREHSRYGTYIIVFSILSGLNLLSLIGGILAVSHNPNPIQAAAPTQQYSPYAQPQQPRRFCTQCGTMVNEYDQFCPHCGKQLN